MEAKSSAKENNDDAFKVLPNQEKVHECGRSEVASVQVGISPLSTKPSFYRIFLVNR